MVEGTSAAPVKEGQPVDEPVLYFFEKMPASLPLYMALEKAILATLPGAVRRAQKTQITFSCRQVFACASLLRVRKANELPSPYLTVSFGLARPLSHHRIAAAVEPYPGRWTHHVVIGSAAEVDNELMGWLTEAAAFAASKR